MKKVTSSMIDAMCADLNDKGVDTLSLSATEINKLHTKFCAPKKKKELTPYQVAKKQLKANTGIRGLFKKTCASVDSTVAGWLDSDDYEVEIVEDTELVVD